MTDFPRLKAKYADLIPPQKLFECGVGWEQVLDKYLHEVRRALTSDAHLRIDRVYQKSGSLRVDAIPEGGITPHIQLALDKAEILAESRSYRFCEACGRLGHLRDKHRRFFVACEAHADGAPVLPPDEGVVRLRGIDYEYDEDVDDLVVVETECEPTS